MSEPNGFSNFLHEMPLFFKIFGGLILLPMAATFLFFLFKGVRTWNSNNHAEIVRRICTIVDKRTEVWGGTHDSGANTNYYVTFEFEDRARKELYVKASLFGLLAVQDRGELTYQGTRFLDFAREIELDNGSSASL
ncbi:DUF2500 domain-containing protein [Cohnella cellulosilytica]|uniref:DUF2500 domain-containing protein n=1 Tax=Cohnella cellulosilytica TaxID=986710 RepID=A0ABW2FJ95_9BACL